MLISNYKLEYAIDYINHDYKKLQDQSLNYILLNNYQTLNNTEKIDKINNILGNRPISKQISFHDYKVLIHQIVFSHVELQHEKYFQKLYERGNDFCVNGTELLYFSKKTKNEHIYKSLKDFKKGEDYIIVDNDIDKTIKYSYILTPSCFRKCINDIFINQQIFMECLQYSYEQYQNTKNINREHKKEDPMKLIQDLSNKINSMLVFNTKINNKLDKIFTEINTVHTKLDAAMVIQKMVAI